MKNPVLLATLLAMHRSDLLDLFIIWAFARTQAEWSASACVAQLVSILGRLGIDRIAARASPEAPEWEAHMVDSDRHRCILDGGEYHLGAVAVRAMSTPAARAQCD